MRKGKLLILFTVFTVFLSILCTGCRRKSKSPDEVIETLKELKTYSSRVDIVIKNDKQEINYSCRQFFDKSEGYRLEIGQDRIQIYKNKKIYVDDRKNEAKYTLEEDFDQLYSLSFIGNYLKLLYTNKENKYFAKTENGINYELVELIIPGNNRNLYKAVMYVNLKNSVPEKIIIYDKKEAEKARMVYTEFKANEVLNKDLFKTE